ncbi:MAG TPA: ABC transporter substrate-binding protein [Jiangellales bacterium]|nr:ABC transporter substrate-binding protein [Jiangellales bacterium]
MKHAWALALVALLIAACGDESAEGDGPATAPTTEQPADDTGFPVTVGTGELSVEIAAPPERIVSLSPTATEMLFAIGADDQVVAADEYSYYPEEAPTTDLSGFTPNVEAIASYDPDLVVAEGDPGDLVSSLAEIGVPTLMHPAAATLDDTYTQIEQLGAATGHVGEAAELVAQMKADIEAVVASLPPRDEPLTYYHELDPNYFSVSSNTFIGQLYGLLGMRSIADEAGDESGGYPQLSPEFIIEADPDVILLADAMCCGVDASQVADRSGWEQLSAVEAGRIVLLDEDVASRWGPRVVEFLETVAADLVALDLLELEAAQ